jgi:methanogenic corrinoid protein MtbC1
LYTQSDIDRFVLLKRLTQIGHSISHIAALKTTDLAKLTDVATREHDSTQTDSKIPPAPDPQTTIDACLNAVTVLDCNELHHVLQQAASNFSRQALLTKIVQPFMDVVGQRWSEGSLRIVHGQMASVVVHAQLISMLDHPLDNGVSGNKPCVLIATPAGQRCYLGALAVAVTAQDHGWEPVFLGSNLPAEEIVAAFSMLGPQMIALSITCRASNGFLHDELIRLSDFLRGQCPLVIGGRASHTYRRRAENLDGAVWATTKELINQLQE